MRTTLPTSEWDWGSRSFKALGQYKVELIYQAISWGLELIITDIDALVLRDPFPFVSKWPDAGFLTTTDYLTNSTETGLESSAAFSSAFNIGYMLWRPSGLPLVIQWRERLRADPEGRWDQGEFNMLASPFRGKKSGLEGPALSDPKLFRCASGVIGGILPVGLFAGGHSYFVSQFARRAGIVPYSVHTTFQYGGAPGKRHRLREAMLWRDEDEYYDPPDGMLMYTAELPDALLNGQVSGRPMSPSEHVMLMTHQLRQIRAALVLAHALGRRLILPQLICGLDKYWAPLGRAGVIPGAPAWAVPIQQCPLDHLFNPAELRPSPEPYVREWSVLHNPRTPNAVKASVQPVILDVTNGEGELQRLRAMRSAKVLNVTNIPATAEAIWAARPDTIGLRSSKTRVAPNRRFRLLDDDGWKSFRSRFGRLQGGWCCAPNGMQPRAAGFHLFNAE